MVVFLLVNSWYSLIFIHTHTHTHTLIHLYQSLLSSVNISLIYESPAIIFSSVRLSGTRFRDYLFFILEILFSGPCNSWSSTKIHSSFLEKEYWVLKLTKSDSLDNCGKIKLYTIHIHNSLIMLKAGMNIPRLV